MATGGSEAGDPAFLGPPGDGPGVHAEGLGDLSWREYAEGSESGCPSVQRTEATGSSLKVVRLTGVRPVRLVLVFLGKSLEDAGQGVWRYRRE